MYIVVNWENYSVILPKISRMPSCFLNVNSQNDKDEIC